MRLSSSVPIHFAVVVEQRADRKRESTITGAKIGVAGVIVVAIIGATVAVTVALVQDKDSVPAFPTATTPGVSSKKVLDESALEGDSGVRKVLIDSYGVGADQIQRVDCPADEEAVAGNTFSCTVQFGGGNRGVMVVDIIVRDDSGEYEVGAPRDR